MALMNEPTVLLLDEPTAGINPTLINGLLDRLKRANTEFGITLFIIEHNMRVIMNMASKIYCLAHGEMLAAGEPGDIQRDQRVIDAYLGAIDGERRTPPAAAITAAWRRPSRSTRWRDRRRRSRATSASTSSTRSPATNRICASTICMPATAPMEILHGFNLRVGRSQSLCLIGPNGAGKSTVLHSIFGFTNIYSGTIATERDGHSIDVTRLSANEKLRSGGIAYILQDKSVFPGMTVEENLWMGGYLMDRPGEAKRAAEKVFDKYPRLAARRKHPAKVLSGGERRLLEISRALVMDPQFCWSTSPRSGSSRASSTRCSRSCATCSTTRARPSSSSSRTPRRAWNSPTSATCWSRANSRSPAGPRICSRTRMSAGCSWAASA